MEESQLVELIRTLMHEEKEKILQIATQQISTGSKMQVHVGRLLHVCLKHSWDDPDKSLEKNEIYGMLFQDAAFVDGKLEKVMVEAHKAIKTFLLTEYYFREENEFHQLLDFAEITRLRGLEARYRSALVRLRKMQEEAPKHKAFYFHDQYLLEYEVHNAESFNNQVKGDLNIPNALDALDMHSCLHNLALLNVYLLQQMAAYVNVSYEMKERLDKVQVPLRYLELSPGIKINFIIFCLLKKEKRDTSDVEELFGLLRRHEKKLDVESLRGFYTYLRNICTLVVTVNPENIDINLTIFDLYQDNLERGYLHYEGKLHPNRYLAISEYAARAQQHDWALAFIEKYKDDIIGENETRDIYRLNMAYYLFSVGQFNACLDYIPGTSPFTDYLLAGKRLELRAYFELNSELLPFKLDAFKMFLSRTSQKLLPDLQRQRNVDFSNLLFQLMTAPPGDQKRIGRLVEKIESKKQASEWWWLMAKAKAMKRH